MKTKVSCKKYLAELKARMPQVGWRLCREECIISAGYQKVARIAAESSTLVRLEINMQALRDQQLQEADVQAV